MAEDHKHSFTDLKGTRVYEVRKVLYITLGLNIAVALAKIIYGYLTGSVGMVSDGFHSFFDGFSNVVGLLGIWIASHPPDEKHPYGHRKFESLFTVIIAVMIFGTCLHILRKVYDSFTVGHRVVAEDISFAVMAGSMAVNLFVLIYETKKGRQYGSEFLIADALHTKSDIYASASVMAGLFFTRIGYPIADAITGLVITFFIGRIGWEILRAASDVMVDTVCINTRLIEAEVLKVPGVRGCHEIRTRGTEQATYLDLHVLVEPSITVDAGHDIAERVEHALREEFPSIVDVVVRIEPDRRKGVCICPPQEG